MTGEHRSLSDVLYFVMRDAVSSSFFTGNGVKSVQSVRLAGWLAGWLFALYMLYSCYIHDMYIHSLLLI